MSVITHNNYGATIGSCKEVKKALISEELSEFEFDVLHLVTDTWGDDCAELLSKEIDTNKNVYTTIFRWLDENEVIPGVGKKLS